MKINYFSCAAIASFAGLVALSTLPGWADPPAAADAVPAAPPAGAPTATAPQGPPPGDPLGPDLYFAIRKNDTAEIKALLKKGAQINGTNWLGITPLMWAAFIGNEAACATLLEHKADFRVDTIYGGALEAADMGGNPRIVRLFLDAGAPITKKRLDKTNVVITAAEAGHTEVLRMLIDRKVGINNADAMGMTPLMHACRRGQNGTVRLLLDAGANVNTSDSYGRTPLMYAALNGHTDTVARLLAAGANAHAKDKKGDSALILAARYSGDASVARLLKSKGADISVTDARKRTACEIALGHGYTEFAGAVMTRVRPAVVAKPAPLAARARQAVQRSLPLIEKSNANFTGKVGCNSCHHQGVGLITTATAKLHGYLISKFGLEKEKRAVVSETENHIEGYRQILPHPEQYKHLPTVDMEEFPPSVGMSYAGLALHGVPASEATAANSTILARLQREDGSWGFGLTRAPVQSSIFMTTAYAIRVLNDYLPSSLAEERRERIAKAKSWLIETTAKNGEDRAFRLIGLKWAGAPESEIKKAVAEIRAAQRKDGGWAQFSAPSVGLSGYSRSDAYATGQSLYALHLGGGVKPADVSYRRGVEYLLRTQDDDGSWFINKRAMPANNYMDTGFPHGVSQYVSYSGTCWATMALMFAADSARSPVLSAKR